jgi:hypothetical protein
VDVKVCALGELSQKGLHCQRPRRDGRLIFASRSRLGLAGAGCGWLGVQDGSSNGGKGNAGESAHDCIPV